MPLSVLIADDNEGIRNAMLDFFETLTDWKVGGEAKDGTEAIQKAMELKPDLVILDFSMPRMKAVEAASVIKGILPKVHIIVFTMFDDALGSRLSSAVGVDLVIPKAEGLTALVNGVQHLMGTTGLLKARAKAKAARQMPGAADQ
jgi:DNA-binding NarL/FixJ family response regulator